MCGVDVVGCVVDREGKGVMKILKQTLSARCDFDLGVSDVIMTEEKL